MKKRAVIVYLCDDEIMLIEEKRDKHSRSDYIRRAVLIQLFGRISIDPQKPFFEKVEPFTAGSSVIDGKMDQMQLESPEKLKEFKDSIEQISNDDSVFNWDPNKHARQDD